MPVERESVEAFLFFEARLQDEHRYDEWEALWLDEALYWVPAGDDDADPETQVSYVYDNRARIARRIKQLNTGRRHAQAPPSRMRRLISNIELGEAEGDLLEVRSNFLLVESRRPELTMWAGHTLHRLKPAGNSFRMALKKVMLVNNDQPIPNLAFLI